MIVVIEGLFVDICYDSKDKEVEVILYVVIGYLVCNLGKDCVDFLLIKEMFYFLFLFC